MRGRPTPQRIFGFTACGSTPVVYFDFPTYCHPAATQEPKMPILSTSSDVSSAVKARQTVEQKIARAIVEAGVAAGYFLAVDYNEDDFALAPTKDVEAIMEALGAVDEEWILFYRDPNSARADGMVFLVYGNDGWDVVNDYSVKLEAIMAPVNALAESLS